MAFVMVVTAVVACGPDHVSVGAFPGLAIKVTCRIGSTAARYTYVDGTYPGERASGDVLEGRFSPALVRRRCPAWIVEPRRIVSIKTAAVSSADL